MDGKTNAVINKGSELGLNSICRLTPQTAPITSSFTAPGAISGSSYGLTSTVTDVVTTKSMITPTTSNFDLSHYNYVDLTLNKQATIDTGGNRFGKKIVLTNDFINSLLAGLDKDLLVIDSNGTLDLDDSIALSDGGIFFGILFSGQNVTQELNVTGFISLYSTLTISNKSPQLSFAPNQGWMNQSSNLTSGSEFNITIDNICYFSFV